MKWTTRLPNAILLLALLAACNMPASPSLTPGRTSTPQPSTPTPSVTPLPALSVLSISPGQEQTGKYLSLSSGGDVDTRLLTVGSPAFAARQTGNGQPLAADDGNTTPDSYIQFNVDDAALFEGQPTSSVRLDVTYYDEGTDTFTVQYDGAAGGAYTDGTFLETRPVYKTNSLTFKTASFVLKDVYFGNRDNGADFRIADQRDGPETIRQVALTLLPVPNVINVDTCGADPFDDLPDSTAIQTCLHKLKDGDTLTFTSGENSPGYRGYVIDKTIFLETIVTKNYLTFTSSAPSNPALLTASADLKGFVMGLEARSSLTAGDAGIQYLTISHLHLDGNRQARACMGSDGNIDGVNDNWGSYLPYECTVTGDPWCSPGTLELIGNQVNNVVADDLHITDTECGTAFGMGGTSMVIMNTTVETAGDHVHAAGCASTDSDQDGVGDWSDGITFAGPDNLILGNTVVDPSDVGIVFFGGRSTVIRNNTVRVTAGNHGAFAGIAVHPWQFGDVAFGQVAGNTVVSDGDTSCGGIHAGINLGPQMWGGGCSFNNSSAVGTATCTAEPVQPKGSPCPANATCQKWAYVPAGTTYLLTDNTVTGAQINFLVDGVDLVGELVQGGNLSHTPRRSDWGASRTGCDGVFWGPTDFVAHDPTLPGWTNIRIHCER